MVLYGPHPEQEGWQLSLKLDNRQVVPLNVPVSDKAVQALQSLNCVYFGIVENGTVMESFSVPLGPACSDTHWTGLDGSVSRARRTIPGFMSFLKTRVFGEPLHVPEGMEDAAPALTQTHTRKPALSPRLAFWNKASKEQPSALGAAWRATKPDSSAKFPGHFWQMA